MARLLALLGPGQNTRNGPRCWGHSKSAGKRPIDKGMRMYLLSFLMGALFAAGSGQLGAEPLKAPKDELLYESLENKNSHWRSELPEDAAPVAPQKYDGFNGVAQTPFYPSPREIQIYHQRREFMQAHQEKKKKKRAPAQRSPRRVKKKLR